MMTRQEIRELAAFQADQKKGVHALSFYFQPDPPQDRSDEDRWQPDPRGQEPDVGARQGDRR